MYMYYSDVLLKLQRFALILDVCLRSARKPFCWCISRTSKAAHSSVQVQGLGEANTGEKAAPPGSMTPVRAGERDRTRERERQREIERDREREGERANTQGSGTTSYQGRDLLQQFEFLELKASIQLAVSCFEQSFAAPACQTSTYENLRVAFHGAGEPVPRGISAPSFFLSLSQCFAPPPPPAASQRQTAETKS